MIEACGCIPATHPSLPGHFPGNPIVPGVVLLDEIVKNAREGRPGLGSHLLISWAKFHAPLRPGEEFATRLEPQDGTTFKFTVRSADKLIASGNLRFE